MLGIIFNYFLFSCIAASIILGGIYYLNKFLPGKSYSLGKFLITIISIGFVFLLLQFFLPQRINLIFFEAFWPLLVAALLFHGIVIAFDRCMANKFEQKMSSIWKKIIIGLGYLGSLLIFFVAMNYFSIEALPRLGYVLRNLFISFGTLFLVAMQFMCEFKNKTSKEFIKKEDQGFSKIDNDDELQDSSF